MTTNVELIARLEPFVQGLGKAILRETANAIEALENKDLQWQGMADKAKGLIDELLIQRTLLKAEVETLRYELGAVPAIKAERDALHAQLTAAQGQEPFRWIDCFGKVTAAKPESNATPLYLAAPIPQQVAEHSGCACRWDADDNRVATCTRHQGWLDVVQEWADRAKAAEALLVSAEPAPTEPDMFWNHDDAEKLYFSIDEFLNDEICNGTPLEVGDTRTIQCALRLPNIEIRITAVHDEGCEADYEVIAAAPQPKEPK